MPCKICRMDFLVLDQKGRCKSCAKMDDDVVYGKYPHRKPRLVFKIRRKGKR